MCGTKVNYDKNPCHNCENRKFKCHSDCIEYTKYKNNIKVSALNKRKFVQEKNFIIEAARHIKKYV